MNKGSLDSEQVTGEILKKEEGDFARIQATLFFL